VEFAAALLFSAVNGLEYSAIPLEPLNRSTTVADGEAPI
jgi:hypothetical protein